MVDGGGNADKGLPSAHRKLNIYIHRLSNFFNRKAVHEKYQIIDKRSLGR